jgi:hypothetical protein
MINLKPMEGSKVVNSAMWRKILITYLLLMLALMPVAQAIEPVIAAGDAGQMSHDHMLMDCGQVDPDHCIDFDDCASGNHNGCDSKTKTGLISLEFIIYPDLTFYDSREDDRYSSHQSALILRPPRNA